MSELEDLCRPIMEYLKDHHNMYTEICVTMDSITVKQELEKIPLKIGDQSED